MKGIFEDLCESWKCFEGSKRVCTYIYIYLYTYICKLFKQKPRGSAVVLNISTAVIIGTQYTGLLTEALEAWMTVMR